MIREPVEKPSSHADLIIKNGFLITLDPSRPLVEHGAIAVLGGRIAEIGDERAISAAWRAPRVIDARGGAVHPGLIDAHNHVVHATCRGLFDGPQSASSTVTFADWKAGVNSEDEFIATQFACLEMLRCGFTMFVEPGSAFDNDAVAAAAESIGLRAMLAGCYVWDNVEAMRHLPSLGSQALYDRSPPRLDRCLDRLGSELYRNKNAEALVRGYVAVYGLGTASDDLLRAAHQLSREAGVVFQQHEGYLPEATMVDRERLGHSRIRHLEDLGVLGPNSVLVHMNVMDDDDVNVLLKSQAQVIWCPSAHLQLGICRAPCRQPEFRARGGRLALGTDGAMNCLIGDAGLCAYLMSANVQHPISPGGILEMQTINAASTIGLAHELGSLEPGKRADIVVRSPRAPEAFPGVNPVHQLALTCRAGTVDTVLVGGTVILRNGKPVLIDEEHVLADVRASVKRRMMRLELSATAYWK